MEKKHTPGPWEYEKTASHTNGLEYFIVYHQEDGVVADMSYNHLKNAEANARLIAAAPELLEACRTAVDNWTITGNMFSAVKACRQAVAKAEGRE